MAKQTNSIIKPNNYSTSTQKADVSNNQKGVSQKTDVLKSNSLLTKEKTNNTGSNKLIVKENINVPSKTTSNNFSSKKIIGKNIAQLRANLATKNKAENNQSAFSPQLSIASPSKDNENFADKHFKSQASILNNIGAYKEKDVPVSDQLKNTIAPIENSKPLPQATDTVNIRKENSSVKSSVNSNAKKKASKNNFYLTLTSGWEASGTSLNNLGAIKPVYGAGVQYSAGKVFARAGMLVTKKIYTAKDKDYSRKGGTWMSIVTFDNIEANCKVVEVPVSIGYHLSSNNKTNVYVTAGTSAHFMKKEDYQFYFKNTSGNDTTRAASFTNNSNHIFSSINLSAGIEQKFNSKFSITAEPNIKIPLSGIGFGKVKLFGAGILVTAKLRLK